MRGDLVAMLRPVTFTNKTCEEQKRYRASAARNFENSVASLRLPSESGAPRCLAAHLSSRRVAESR